MGLFGLFEKKDDVREHAHRIATDLVKYRQSHPAGPLHPAVKAMSGGLWKYMKKPGQKAGLDFLISDKFDEESIQEACCAVVALVTDTPLSNKDRYANLEQVVKEEIAAARTSG